MKQHPPHSKDLRKGRCSQNHRVYMITAVTYQRQQIFTDFQLGRIVINTMRQQYDNGLIDSLAFVIMPDHLHWLFSLQNDCTLAKLMHLVKGSSAFQIQKLQRQRGDRLNSKQRLWQNGYHDHAVRKEEDIKRFARYIVANPLRAGLVKRITDYPLWDAVWLSSPP